MKRDNDAVGGVNRRRPKRVGGVIAALAPGAPPLASSVQERDANPASQNASGKVHDTADAHPPVTQKALTNEPKTEEARANAVLRDWMTLAIAWGPVAGFLWAIAYEFGLHVKRAQPKWRRSEDSQ